MAYTSTTATLAMLEFLAHVDTADFDPSSPAALVLVTAQIDDADVATFEDLGVTLPADWRSAPAPLELAGIGDAWIAGATSVALAVPSALLPRTVSERNVLINPSHHRFPAVTWRIDDFAYDNRLLS